MQMLDAARPDLLCLLLSGSSWYINAGYLLQLNDERHLLLLRSNIFLAYRELSLQGSSFRLSRCTNVRAAFALEPIRVIGASFAMPKSYQVSVREGVKIHWS